MLELGDHALALHEECGRAAAAAGLDLLFAVGGAPARALADAAVAAGMPAARGALLRDRATRRRRRSSARVRAGDLVLVKGSRGTRTDVVVDRHRGGVRLMLFYLLPQLADVAPFLGVLNVTRYITFRTAAASLTALAISLVLGPWMIRKLRDFQIGQVIRQEGPQSHRAKAGTPTMGGLLILTRRSMPTLLWADLTNPYVWIAVLATVGVRRRRLPRRLPEDRRAARITG